MSTPIQGAKPSRHPARPLNNPDLNTQIYQLTQTHGPVFRLPAMRPTFVLTGHEALSILSNQDLVERSPSVIPAHVTVANALCDEGVSVLSMTNGEEHQRRLSGWWTPGNLDRAGVLAAASVVANLVDDSLRQWQRQQVFSLNEAVRRACWKIASVLGTGSEADDALLADFETFLNINPYADLGQAKQRVSQWLERVSEQSSATTPAGNYCIARQLASSNTLSKSELINEIRHGVGGTLLAWTPLTELLRQLSQDSAEASRARDEIKALGGDLSPRHMAQTSTLTSLISKALQRCSPLPVIFSRAKVAFCVAGVDIPADAVLMGSLHATNWQNLDQHEQQDAPLAPVTFGKGLHACPAANLVNVILWIFAVRFAALYRVKQLDCNDQPVQTTAGYFAPKGCFVKLLSAADAHESSSMPAQAITTLHHPEHNANPIRRSDRIAIIGAGITGLTLAFELKKQGYANVTVFERAPTIGGKADTVYVDSRPYNVGAHLCHGNLGVAQLAREVGVSLERSPSYELWDIDNNQAIPRNFEHYQQVDKLRQILAANPDLEHDAGFAPTESWTYSSIKHWLAAHELSDLADIGPFFTGAGYGFLQDDVPAGFFLKFAQHMTEDGWTPSGGYKYLLEQVSKDLDVRCNTEVVSVIRNLGADMADKGQIQLQTCTPSASTAIDHHEFDRLILTGPLEHASQFLALSDAEKALFPRIKSLDYYTLIATLDIAKPHTPGLYIVPKNTGNSGARGHTTAFERAFEDSTIYHFFCYGQPGQSDADILANLREDARKLGGEITDIHLFQKWAYAPQVSPHDMALGFYRRIEEMQGLHGTYYAGSLLAFELTDHNVLLAKNLVERFFATPETSTAADLPSGSAQVLQAQSTPAAESSPRNVLDILKIRYETTPGKVFSTFLDAKGKEVRTLTYKELVERATACAVSLRSKGVVAGDRVALVYPPDTDEFMVGFFGCLIAQAIAVPVACPDPRKLDVEIPRFAHIMQDCDCRVALTTRVYQAIALVGRTWNTLTNITSSNKVKWPKLTWLSTDGLAPMVPGNKIAIPSPAPETIAYLQYTSGSTSDPKGVMINHGNILHNVESICVQTDLNEQSVLVGWVPLFHDMGLVGGPLTTLFSGATLAFFSPMSFLQNPALWVKTMHKYRATHTESPNFGYEFLLRNLDEKSLAGVDLSSLRYTLFGGEVMRPRTFERMAEILHGTGFRAETMTNIFGAAEATLFLAGGGIGAPPLLSVDTKQLETKRRAVIKSPDLRSTTTLIGCGLSTLNSDLRIVDPTSKRLLPDGEVGEIWLSSPSVSQGYWGRSQDVNDLTFRARIADDPSPLRTYLRSGDLGFVLNDTLYICGRVKEMMIFNGRNIHPMDIELCIMNAHPAIRKGCVVTFSIEENTQEKLIVVAELKNTAEASSADAAAAIAQVLAEQHNLAARDILLVRSGTLPKTSSGKLQRYRAREQYLAKQLSQLHNHATADDHHTDLSNTQADFQPMLDELDKDRFNGDLAWTRDWLTRLLAVSLRVDANEIDGDLEFTLFGIDSAQALAMTSRISRFVGHAITPSTLYEQPTINTLAHYLCSDAGSESKILVRLQKGDHRIFPRLFCVHPVGGSPMAYAGLAERMPDEIPVYAFSNESNSVPDDDLESMASHYVQAMRAEQPDGPYYLLGYSFGGTVAYEMARQILNSGGTVGGLFLIDSPAPLYQGVQGIQTVAEQEAYDGFFETAILNELIPDQWEDSEREKMRARIDRNHRALANYRINLSSIRPVLRLYRASEEAHSLRETTRHPAFDAADFGWGSASPGSVIETITIPGDHFSVMKDPVTLAEHLARRLSILVELHATVLADKDKDQETVSVGG